MIVVLLIGLFVLFMLFLMGEIGFKFKIGDKIFKKGTDEFDMNSPVFEILKVGKYSYQVKYLKPKDMKDYITTRDIPTIRVLYTKYNGDDV